MTVYTLHNIPDETIPITNIHGQEFQIKKSFLEGVLMFAWIFQVLAIAVNLGGYLIHPMAVEMPGSNKMFVPVFGHYMINVYYLLDMIMLILPFSLVALVPFLFFLPASYGYQSSGVLNVSPHVTSH